MGELKSKSSGFDFVVGYAFISTVHAGQFGIPVDRAEVAMVGDLLIEILSGGVFIVDDVIDAFQVVAKGVIEGGGHVGFMDHVCVLLAGSGQAVSFHILDAAGNFPAGPVNFG